MSSARKLRTLCTLPRPVLHGTQTLHPNFSYRNPAALLQVKVLTRNGQECVLSYCPLTPLQQGCEPFLDLVFLSELPNSIERAPFASERMMRREALQASVV